MYQIKTLDGQFNFSSIYFLKAETIYDVTYFILVQCNLSETAQQQLYRHENNRNTTRQNFKWYLVGFVHAPVWRAASCPPRPGECRRWCWRWSSWCSTPSLSPSCHEAGTLLTSTVTGEVRGWTGTSHSVGIFVTSSWQLFTTLLKLLPSDHEVQYVSKSENCCFY